jgi:deazaflavin-dependent oxidoreductase (nitroreductase family)
VGWYTRAVQRLGHERWTIAIARRVLHLIDMALLRISRGRIHSMPIPTLVLTTRGRRSGRRHAVPLFFATVGDAPVVGDFNAGRPAPPCWAENLIADPNATIEIGGGRREVAARLLGGPERAEAWKRLLAIWPGYREVATETGRSIRLFRLEARPGA